MKGLILNSDVIIRPATHKDVRFVLKLMRQLAEFENYSDEFRVTEASLSKTLFVDESASVLVAVKGDDLVGILVYYPLPFTFDCSPWWVIKELYVDAAERSGGLGERLMKELFERARCAGVTRMRWEVLRANVRAQAFYQSLGGHHREEWLPYGVCIL